MKFKIISLFFFIALFATAIIYNQNFESAKSNQIVNSEITLPNITLTTIANESINLTDTPNKTIIINFWASWCTPCIEEMPSLLQLANNTPDEIILIAISIDNNIPDLTNFLNKINYQSKPNSNIYFVFDENKEISRNYFKTVKVPETFIIKNNKIIKKVIGAVDWNQNFIASF